MLPALMSLRRPAGRKQRRMIKATVKINSAVLLSKPYNFRLSGVPNNLYGLTGMLNVDEDAALVDIQLEDDAEAIYSADSECEICTSVSLKQGD